MFPLIHQQQNVEQQYAELKVLQEKRAKRLEESRKLFVFLRESDEVGEWLNEQMVVAASEDYGRDVEHVEILIQKFESFLSVLAANEEKLTIVKGKAKLLLDDGHSEPAKIQNKVISYGHKVFKYLIFSINIFFMLIYFPKLLIISFSSYFYLFIDLNYFGSLKPSFFVTTYRLKNCSSCGRT